MLRQKLLIGDNVSQDVKSEIADLLGEDSAAEEAKDTLSPQCEHIVVQAVKSWGGADVTVAELEDTIADVLLQVRIVIVYICMSYLLHTRAHALTHTQTQTHTHTHTHTHTQNKSFTSCSFSLIFVIE